MLGAVLFASAGTLAWPAGWVFLAIMVAGSAVFEVMLLLHADPAELLAGRLRAGSAVASNPVLPTIRRGTFLLS